MVLQEINELNQITVSPKKENIVDFIHSLCPPTHTRQHTRARGRAIYSLAENGRRRHCWRLPFLFVSFQRCWCGWSLFLTF